MMRRIHRIVFLLALLIGSAGMSYVQAAVYSGTCGAAGNEANVTWELDTEDGSLFIKGTGAMTHYWSLTDIPWYAYRQYITGIYVSVTAIGHHAFYDCSNVTEISLSNSLTSIGVLSFGFCRKLTTLEIPNSVTSIGDQALWYNESLKEVHVKWTGDAVPTMPANIHNFEASQIRLHIPCGQTAAYTAKGWSTKFTLVEGLDVGTIETTTDYFPWVLTCDSIWKVSGTGALKDFPNPRYVDLGIARVTINLSSLSPVFSKRKVVKEAVFEEGITYIGNNTFYKGTYHSGYHYLTTLTLPSTLTSMSSTAFKGCIALKDVYVSWTTAATIPTWNQTIDVSSTTLHVPCGTTALYRAKGWQNFIIKEERGHGTCGAEGSNVTWALSCDGVLTIRGLGAMKDYTHTNNLPWVSHRDAITTIIIEEGVTTIGDRAFGYSTNATSVTIPSSVTSIGDYAFIGCSSLQEITIPNTINALGIYMLYACSSLTDIYASWISEIPAWPTNFTNNSPQSSVTLHVPCSAMSLYKAADGWKDYTIEGEGGPYTITVESDDPSMGTVDAVKIGE